MRRSLFVVLFVLLLIGLAPSASPADAGLVRRAIEFEVENVGNRSALSCSSDGLRYRIRGEVVGPASLLRSASIPVATLYLHEFSFGRFFWQFDDVPGYDHVAELARAGHASIVVDRLGYDGSGHPPGTATCLGAQADVVAQLVRQLRDGTAGVTVERIVLAGHSVGGGIAELAAHSFDLDIAGLMLFGWADQGYSSRTIEQSARQGLDCQTRSERAEPGGPDGYAFFGRTEAEFQENVFRDTDPAVVERATAKRNRDPCGDNATLVRFAIVNQQGVKKITAPVLLVFGEEDAVFQDDAMQSQAELFEGSSEVTTRAVPGAGHALMLERSAPLVRRMTVDWLTASGLAAKPAPRRPPPPPRPGPTGDGGTRGSPETLPVVEDGSVTAGAVPTGGSLPVTGAGPPTIAFLLLFLGLLPAYVLSRARRSTSSTMGTMSAGGLLPRKARNSGMAAAASFLSWKRIMPLKKRASG